MVPIFPGLTRLETKKKVAKLSHGRGWVAGKPRGPYKPKRRAK